jgi:hypothetical protein
MPKYIFTILCSFIFYVTTYAQSVGIGTNAPNPCARLDISATNKGLLIPRVSLINILDSTTIPGAAIGLLVYNTNTLMTGSSYSDKTGFFTPLPVALLGGKKFPTN